ncbi:pentatricopeptide repeat-containing protein At1g05750, chloroplastic-like [Ziziphus jujuba]|uniref:Pentatricopeptide repeat-containing protein At1g05750, chloroplastic-like n=1 Tax=Ziziphus jujuba TaxID=326968 RepID=A0ABM3I2X0_ZIZJJ|nr:pentatricopeptide repeat-containing protein At1g05750, chloroplastic-like [Ziziphus jujuba]
MRNGEVEFAVEMFEEMPHRDGVSVKPRIENYGCMVDLYSRAGRMEDALHVIEKLPMEPNEVVVGSLLAACRIHGDFSLAEWLIKYLFELDPGVDSDYVILANIYAAVGRWDGAGKVKKTIKALGVQKTPGLSSIEIDCNIHEFVAGDKFHVDTECIYEMIRVSFSGAKSMWIYS